MSVAGITCLVPALPSHARLKRHAQAGHKLVFGELLQYVCDVGHVLVVGDLERLCLMTGQWTGEPPQCQRMSNYVKNMNYCVK